MEVESALTFAISWLKFNLILKLLLKEVRFIVNYAFKAFVNSIFTLFVSVVINKKIVKKILLCSENTFIARNQK